MQDICKYLTKQGLSCYNNNVCFAANAARKKGGDELKDKKMSLRLLSMLSAAFLSVQAFPMAALADTDVPDIQDEAAVLTLAQYDALDTAPLYVEQETYNDYYNKYSQEHRPEQDIVISGSDYTAWSFD